MESLAQGRESQAKEMKPQHKETKIRRKEMKIENQTFSICYGKGSGERRAVNLNVSRLAGIEGSLRPVMRPQYHELLI